MSIAVLAGGVAVALLALHVLSAALAGRRWRTGAGCSVAPAEEVPPVSVVRPLHGLDANDRATLASTFALIGCRYEVILCVEREDDAAVPYARELMAANPHVPARLLIGHTANTANPKLDNVEKGWRAARHDLIVLSDCNLMLPPDYLLRLHKAFRADTLLVSAPPLGGAPASFWAEVECAFLDTYQGRWQYAADSVGYGFAQGKTLCLRRSDLDRMGGLGALATELAEDAAATKAVRAAGGHVRLVDRPFEQPLGHRTRAAVWQRQLRWAQLRRLAFPAHYFGEVLTSPLAPLLAAMMWADDVDISVPSAVAATLAVWYGTEAWLARTAGLHMSWRSPFAWLARDAMLPVLWVAGWLRSGYEWRGNRVSVDGDAPASDAGAVTGEAAHGR